MNKFQDWADRRKPKVTPKVILEVEEQSTPEDQLREAWEDWKYEFRTPIRIFKFGLGIFIMLTTLLALAVVSIQADCYLDSECRESIQKVNK